MILIVEIRHRQALRVPRVTARKCPALVGQMLLDLRAAGVYLLHPFHQADQRVRLPQRRRRGDELGKRHVGLGTGRVNNLENRGGAVNGHQCIPC